MTALEFLGGGRQADEDRTLLMCATLIGVTHYDLSPFAEVRLTLPDWTISFGSGPNEPLINIARNASTALLNMAGTLCGLVLDYGGDFGAPEAEPLDPQRAALALAEALVRLERRGARSGQP